MARLKVKAITHRADQEYDRMVVRGLLVAILVSLALHIFCLSAVSIITPDAFPKRRGYTRVNFLGPVLNQRAFDVMMDGLPAPPDVPVGPEVRKSEQAYLEPPLFVERIRTPDVSSRREYLMSASALSSLMARRVLPKMPGSSPGGIKIMEGSLGLPRTNGDLLTRGEREVIYKPPAPRLAHGAAGTVSEASVEVRVLVDPSGSVTDVETITSAGITGVDEAAVQNVKNWVFEGSEGIVTQWLVLEVKVILEGPEQ